MKWPFFMDLSYVPQNFYGKIINIVDSYFQHNHSIPENLWFKFDFILNTKLKNVNL